MKKIESTSVIFFLILLSTNVFAIEDKIFDLNGSDTHEVILKKIGTPEGVKIESKKNPEKMVSLDFTTPHEFNVSEKDLFEQIEIGGKRDIVNSKIIVSDPKTGRIFHLNTELKVTELDIVKPWTPKNKLKTFKEIFIELNQHKIQKNSKKKVEVKK